MMILRAAAISVLSLVLVGPAWAAEAKPVKKPDQKGEQKKKLDQKARQNAKQSVDSVGGESTDKKVEGTVLRGIQRQVVELREYSGLELKVEGSEEAIKLLVPFVEDATTKRLSVDREKMDQLARLRIGWTVRVTYYADKDWNWIRKLEILDEGEDREKDSAKDKKDSHNNNRDRDRYNRNRRRNYNDRNRGAVAKPQPQNNQAKPSGPAPNPSNMQMPQKIAPMPMKIK